MRLSDLGEKETLKVLKKILASPSIGDDCLAIPISRDHYLLVTVDGIHEKTDIPKGMSYYDAGWYACSSTISDIVSKGGRPLSVLVSLFLPKNFEIKNLIDFLKGIEDCAAIYGAFLDGGDLNYGESFSADIVGVGIVEKKYYVSRYGARPGDIVIVTGTFGTPSAVLDMLYKGKNVEEEIINKLFRPKPRFYEAYYLISTGLITSSIDSSDGLYESLRILSESSEVKIDVKFELIPKDRWLEEKFSKEEIIRHVLFGGGEFELIMTAKPEISKYLENVSKITGTKISIIGEVLEGEGVQITINNKPLKVEGYGWDPFK